MVVFLHPHFCKLRGASRFTYEIVKRLQKNGFECCVVTIDKGDTKLIKKANFKLYELGGKLTNSFFYWVSFPYFLVRLIRKLNSISNKIIFAQSSPSHWWAGIYKILYPDTKIIWMCHEPNAFLYVKKVRKSLPVIFRVLISVFSYPLKVIDKFFVNRIDSIVANSKYGAKLIYEVYKRSADLVLYPSIDPDQFKVGGMKKNYILTLGGIDYSKRIDVLIKGYDGLPESLKNKYKLVIVGEGDDVGRLKRIIRDTGNGNRVLIWGKVVERELNKVYAEANLFLYGSENEAFAMTPLEAMASGTVVLSINSGGLKEIVRESEGGFLVDKLAADAFSKKMEWILRNPLKVKESEKKARKYVLRNFSWDRQVDKLRNYLVEFSAK